MARGSEAITLYTVGKRLLGKLREPGVLDSMKRVAGASGKDEVSLGQMVGERASVMPGHAAIRFGQRQWTWSEFNAGSNRLAHELAARGLGIGDVVAINIGNRPELLMLAVAASKLGAIAAMVNTTQREDVLAHSLALVKPKLVIADEGQLDAMRSIPQAVAAELAGKLLYVGEAGSARVPDGYDDLIAASAHRAADEPRPGRPVTLSDPCFYIFTSGTTGMPKASVMTNLRLYRTAISFGQSVLNLTSEDCIYCCLPFYHGNALTIAFGSALATGASIAIGRRFSASGFWDDVRHYDATAFAYIGELLRYLLNPAPNEGECNHRVSRIVGNGLRPDVWDQVKARFGIDKIYEFYGASEGTIGFVNSLNFDKTCGFAPAGWEIVEYDVDADEPVRSARGRLRKLGRGRVGLLISQVNEQLPYDGYTSAEASEKKLLRDVFRAGDCWFNTGDLVRKQGWGHVQFVDRVGDTYRWQGENVATTEVEAVALQWPQTNDVVAYGVSVPGRDGRCGMLSWSCKSGETPDLDGLAAHLRRKLPKYAVPRFLRVESDHVLTGTFKHQKAHLKRDGYDPARIAGQLYVLAPDAQGWQLLTADVHDDIDAGRLRL